VSALAFAFHSIRRECLAPPLHVHFAHTTHVAIRTHLCSAHRSPLSLALADKIVNAQTPIGINMGSQFNSDNVTAFEEKDQAAADAAGAGEAEGDTDAASDAMVTDEVAKEGDRSTHLSDAPVDYVFYRRFWTLQKCVSCRLHSFDDDACARTHTHTHTHFSSSFIQVLHRPDTVLHNQRVE
jgi:hypothetical protein